MARGRYNQPYRYRVSIQTNPRSGGDLPGFLDMLRYESARVVSWDHVPSDREDRFEVTLETETFYRHVPERWASFGITAKEVER